MKSLRNILSTIFLGFFFFVPGWSLAQSISIDEDFTDWENVATLYEDAFGDNAGSPIDFKTLKITNDDLYIYLYLEVGHEINLQQNNEISLLLDLDSNSETGEPFLGIGYELIFNFGQRNGQFYNPNSTVFDSYEIGLVSAPTVSSDVFEIKINRNAEIDGTPVFTNQYFDFLIRSQSSNGDLIPDNGSSSLTYSFDSETIFITDPYSLSKKHPEDLRVLSYNVLRDNLFNPSAKENFRRIFQAVDPDIIGLQEVYNNSGADAATLIEEFLPSEAGQQWYSADVGNDNLIVSRFPVLQQKGISGNAAYLLNLGDRELLAVVAHPPCCNNNDNRQKEIDAFMAFIRDSKTGLEFNIKENTPIIVLGDMNLVGFVQQQSTLIKGDIVNEGIYGPDFNPDWDGTAFEDLKPGNPDSPTTFTWYSTSSSFGAGRLDYIVYSGSVLEATNGFSLHASTMHPDSLPAYGLEKNDTEIASDHLPLVGDFQFKVITSNEASREAPSDFQLFQNYPNPFNPSTNISFRLQRTSSIQLEVFDILGRKVSTLFEGMKPTGTYTITFNASSLNSGVYYYSLTFDGTTLSKKMLLIK